MRVSRNVVRAPSAGSDTGSATMSVPSRGHSTRVCGGLGSGAGSLPQAQATLGALGVGAPGSGALSHPQ